MYISPHEAMELLQITTRQGLHKVATNHNITIKSQGAGKPNLYFKEDLERYMSENSKNIGLRKTKTVKEKAIKVKKEKVERKVKAEELKEETKKTLAPPNKQTDEPTNPLNHIGQDEFNRIVEILTENGTYKEQDRALVLVYAINYQNYIFATLASSREDNTTTDQFGVLKLHPYFHVAKECASQMTKIANLLGLGVRSRIGLDVKKEKKKSVFDMMKEDEKFD